LCCVSHNGDGDDHGVRRADTARAHARWRNLVALHEAGGMVVAITVESSTFFYIVFNRLTSFYFITQVV
jgi:hypothetical protein